MELDAAGPAGAVEPREERSVPAITELRVGEVHHLNLEGDVRAQFLVGEAVGFERLFVVRSRVKTRLLDFLEHAGDLSLRGRWIRALSELGANHRLVDKTIGGLAFGCGAEIERTAVLECSEPNVAVDLAFLDGARADGDGDAVHDFG